MGSVHKELEKNSRHELHFEKLRDKYHLIIDDDLNLQFSRKHPFIPWEFITERTPAIGG